ncbi:MAG: DNA translocase FtsK 4TM domain-containing protein [Elusimicrobiota bacterium]
MPKIKKQISDSTKRKDITGIFLVAFSMILFISFISGGDKKYVGAVGSLLSVSLTDFLGYVCYLIPLILLWWAVTEFKHKIFQLRYSMCAGFLLATAGATILLHVIFGEKAGGILGDFSTDVIIRSVFGHAGAYILSGAMLLISFILMADISIKNSLAAFSKIISAIARSLLKRKTKTAKPDVVPKPAKEVKDTKKIFSKTCIKPKKDESGKKKDKQKQIKPEPKDVPQVDRSSLQLASGGTVLYSIPLELLAEPPVTKQKLDEEAERGNKLIEVLSNFEISAEISHINIGPAITRYEIVLPPDIKLSRIRNLESNIAMALEAKTVRLLTPIPGKAAVGVEVPALEQETVYLRDILSSEEYTSLDTNLPYCLGKTVDGTSEVADLSQMPHLLLAGATGSGKSVAIHGLINSILFKSSPDEVRFLFIDPKRVELPVYNGIPHLDCDVVTDSAKAVKLLNAVTMEMDSRYDILAANNVLDLASYNSKAEKNEDMEKMPHIVVVIDELADLMVLARDKVELAIVRIAQMARAVGIHLVLATQRPSVDVITGIIKANLPARIAFNVLSGVDSRTILDSNGAEKLLGKGDMLYLSTERPQPERLQGCFVARNEVERVVEYLRNTDFKPRTGLNLEGHIQKKRSESSFEDDIYPEALEMVAKLQKASISLLQRRLRIGYNRAARIIDKMEDSGIISEDNGTKGREVLVSEDYFDDKTD